MCVLAIWTWLHTLCVHGLANGADNVPVPTQSRACSGISAVLGYSSCRTVQAAPTSLPSPDVSSRIMKTKPTCILFMPCSHSTFHLTTLSIKEHRRRLPPCPALSHSSFSQSLQIHLQVAPSSRAGSNLR